MTENLIDTENLVEVVRTQTENEGIRKAFFKLGPMILYQQLDNRNFYHYKLFNINNDKGIKFTQKNYQLFLNGTTGNGTKKLLKELSDHQEEYLKKNKCETIVKISASLDNENVKFTGFEYSFNNELEIKEIDYKSSLNDFVGFTMLSIPLFHNMIVTLLGDEESEQEILTIDKGLSYASLLEKENLITKEEFKPYLEEILGILLNDIDFISDIIKKEAGTNEPLKQLDYKSPASLSYPMQKIIRVAYGPNNYDDQDLENGAIEFNADITNSKSKKTKKAKKDLRVINKLFLLTDQRLNYFDYLTFSAYYTLVQLNPDQYITYLDIANTIHKTKSGKHLESKDRFIEEVRKSITKQRQILVGDFDFTQEAKNYPKKGLTQLLENGGARIGNFNLIFATEVEFIEKPNKRVLRGLAPAGGPESDYIHKTLFAYIDANNQIKTLSNEFLINPLNVSVENEMIFHYMIDKLTAMPYGIKNKYLSTINETNTPRSYKYADKQNSINIDTLIKELNLDVKQKSRYTKKMEKVLNFWKSNGFIINYDIRKNGRSKTSYLLAIQ